MARIVRYLHSMVGFDRLRPAKVAGIAVIAFALVGLAACGGSGGASGSNPTATESKAPTTAPTETKAPTTAQTATQPASSSGQATQAPAGESVDIGAYDIYFKPNVITIPADTPVTLNITNHGAIAHDFSITDHNNPNVKNLGISVNINPGETKSVTVNAPAGTYYFYCNVPGHEEAGMFGYLEVKAGAAIATADETVTPPAGS